MIALAGKRIAQHAIDALPGGEHLPAFARGDHPAVATEHFARRDLDAEIAQVKTKRRELRDQPALGDNAGAAIGELPGHALEDLGLPAAAAEHRRR